MRIVINALAYKSECSGIGILLREMFGALTAEIKRPCQVVLPKESPPFPCSGNAALFTAPCTYEQGLRRMFFQSFIFGPLLCNDAVLLTVDSKIPLFLPKSCRLLPLITDLAVFRMGQTYPLSRAILWRFQYRHLLRRTDCFLAISEFTKRELTDVFGIPAERIRVIPCSAGNDVVRIQDTEAIVTLRRKYALPEEFILFVGNPNPRKNLDRLIQAYELMKRRSNLPHSLVIAGSHGWKFNQAKALKGRKDIRFIGYVREEDMSALYSAAAALVFPTLYEGFGLPVVEAQRCGVPVLTSGISALPETAGKGALYVDPDNAEEIAEGIERILTDTALRTQLIQEGFENAKRFSWERSAEKVNEVIEEIIGGPVQTGC